MSVVVAASASSSVSRQGGGLLRRELFYDNGWRMCRIYRPHVAQVLIARHRALAERAVIDGAREPVGLPSFEASRDEISHSRIVRRGTALALASLRRTPWY